MIKRAKNPLGLSRVKNVLPYMYLLPLALSAVVFSLYPIINAFITSLKEDYAIISDTYSGLGFSNFKQVLQNEYFLQAARNTMLYALTMVPLTIGISLILAAALNRKLRMTPVFQVFLFLPFVTSATAIGYAWRYIFHYNYGIVNYFLQKLSLEPINWLGSTEASLFMLCIFGVWINIPFTTIIFLSSLQSIDNRLFTIARIDGATSTKAFGKITVPLMLPTILVMTLLNSIKALQVFDELFPLFLGKPGPYYNLYTVVYYIFEQLRGSNRYGFGRAAAVAVLLFLSTTIVLLAVFLVRKIFLFMRYGDEKKQSVR